MAFLASSTQNAAGSADNLMKRYVVSLEQTRYLATPTTLQRLLEKTFNKPFDANSISVSERSPNTSIFEFGAPGQSSSIYIYLCIIFIRHQTSLTLYLEQEKNHRLIYHAERELDETEIEYVCLHVLCKAKPSQAKPLAILFVTFILTALLISILYFSGSGSMSSRQRGRPERRREGKLERGRKLLRLRPLRPLR